MPAVSTANYPSLNTVANLIRSIVDDDKAGATGTPGEGQIFTNTSVSLQNFLNSAIRDLYRDIKIMGQPTLIRDNYLLYNVNPVNSPLGVGVPNPDIQTSLTFTGFFDGLLIWPLLLLPSDLILPLELWSRPTSSGLPFREMKQVTGPLHSYYQGAELRDWEWRTDGIWMNGSTQPYDIRIRYLAKYVDLVSADINWDTTYIPVLDCEECLSDKVAVKIAQRLGGETLADAIMSAKGSLLKLRQQVTRDRQKIDFRFRLFNGENQN